MTKNQIGLSKINYENLINILAINIPEKSKSEIRRLVENKAIKWHGKDDSEVIHTTFYKSDKDKFIDDWDADFFEQLDSYLNKKRKFKKHTLYGLNQLYLRTEPITKVWFYVLFWVGKREWVYF